MYNLLISLALGAIAFGLGALGGRWIYGLAPAIFIAPVVYFFLARRSGQMLQAIMTKAANELQQGRIEPAKKTIESALPLGKWQFLVEKQINAQLGALEYMQGNKAKARDLLERSWNRNWQAMAMLAVLDTKSGAPDKALARLEKVVFFGRKESLLWGVWVWCLLQAKDVDAAQAKAVEGIEATDGAQPLKDLQNAIANDRMKRFKWGKVFGQGWYQFFPEMVPRQQMASNPGNFQGRKTWPQPRR